MRVHHMCVYYSQYAHKELAPRSEDQWQAFKFCRAVKSRTINGFIHVPLKSGAVKIDAENVGEARKIFGKFIRDRIQRCSISYDMIVPIPSKDGLVEADQFRSNAMLEEALGGSPIHQPILRFTEKLVPASQGGPRGRAALQPYLKVIGDVRGKKILLIDDIYTTGGSLRASVDAIEAAGGSVTAGIVCGYTVSDSIRPAFGLQHIDLVSDEIL